MVKQPITVLLVEDHELTRHGLAYGLGKFPEVKLLASAENGEEAIALIEEHHPQVVLMDIVMPVLNGCHATKQIKEKYPETKILMLTSHAEQDKVFEAFAAGADGYCLKDVSTERLTKAIEMVMDGVVWLDPGIAGYILKAMPMISQALTKSQESEKNRAEIVLTAREKEILSLIAEGINNKDISERLSISLYTVKNHVSSIIQKLAVDDRTQAAVLALKKGII
jgi:two-component system, NarL family, response regulator DegU